MSNPNVKLTLDEAVAEVLSELYGLDLAYDPSFDRYRTVARYLNRALRANALEKEWSCYASVVELGPIAAGQNTVVLTNVQRPRIIGDDAVRFLDADGNPVIWAYFLPRDSLHKYAYQPGFWCSIVGTSLLFSQPFTAEMDGLMLQLPIMREPELFAIPAAPENPADPLVTIDPAVRAQEVDFVYPDVITARAAYLLSLADPVIQPRSQTLESAYKDLMYQAIERDDRNTDTPYLNDFIVPVQGTVYPESAVRPWPLADRRH